MQGARNGSAAAPALSGGIVRLQLALAAEASDDVDFSAHLGCRDLRAGRGHRRTDGPAPGALRPGRGSHYAYRKRRSGQLETGHPVLSPSRTAIEPPRPHFEHACKLGLEGIVSKAHPYDIRLPMGKAQDEGEDSMCDHGRLSCGDIRARATDRS